MVEQDNLTPECPDKLDPETKCNVNDTLKEAQEELQKKITDQALHGAGVRSDTKDLPYLPGVDGKTDPWKHRSKGMTCGTCMYNCNKRCRRHAPTMAGYPAVFDNDWCGDHKLDKATMGGE